MNDFEQSLKEHVEDFKMIPSKRVWHSIYNDIHPGRRWPSVAMSLLLMFTLVVIGHLNTHNGAHYANYKTAEVKSSDNRKLLNTFTNNQKIALKNNSRKNTSGYANQIAGSKIFLNLSQNNFTSSAKKNPDNINATPGQPFPGNYTDSKKLNNSTSSFSEKSSTSGLKNIDNVSQNTQAEQTDKIIELKKSLISDYYENEFIQDETAINNADDLFHSLNSKNVDNDIFLKSLANSKNDTSKNLLTFVGKTIKSHKKRNENISWTLFAAPVISNVAFTGKEIRQIPGTNVTPTVAINTKENKVLHSAALGLEAGFRINYTLAKKLQFTSGFHITYSGYRTVSNEVHPTFATLILKNAVTGIDYPKTYITHYGDGTGEASVTLRNYSWQLSVPVGLQYEFFGNKKIQFNTAADIEPSYVIKGNGYILSSDGENYINDPSLLRKWNASSNFGAFISFSSAKLKWQIGPNVRYQWLSTYQKDYSVKEHLVDYGIRIGISK